MVTDGSNGDKPLSRRDFNAFEKRQDQRLDAFEKRQQRFISQRLETHSISTAKKIDEAISGLRTELKDDIKEVLAASATAHKEIIERLERLENNRG